MAHIDLHLDENRYPGITGLMRYRPQVAGPLNDLVNTLLHAPHPTLSPGERELVAAYVSHRNDCRFCSTSHAAFAAEQLDGGMPLVREVCDEPEGPAVPPKLRALLAIADATRRGGREVTAGLVAAARDAGATDLEIHDVVLIAAAFSMFNRYVDGLGTTSPADPSVFQPRAREIAQHGYR
ncbi:carboxymuconolactone decarboxylase family protein [Actinoplanes sp. N902-109]|uniref:carboxymuconolactone decarboxylase family protein n=1 Tax=Actinoplanes sp. (strain N902-109) TaxID=649831 RepID=UPI0005A0F511|nr:carboxymuconolactone decarboxylase family protein [Actinoplanes sp. N902-109]